MRARVNCRDPARLRGFVEIFFNGVGYEIKFCTEGATNSMKNKDAPPESEKPNDKKDGADKGDDNSQK